MNLLEHGKVVAVLRYSDKDLAQKAASVVIEAGLKIIEVTYTTPGATDIINELKQNFPEAIIGAGSIKNLEDAREALEAGAAFSVSPHFDKELSDFHLNHNHTYIPGGMTPSELSEIYRAGHKIQKLFPASIVGINGVKNILAPLPELNLITTGGVNLENASDYLKAGARLICVGGELFQKDLIKKQDWDELSKVAKLWKEIH